jgi:hypothetical protein
MAPPPPVARYRLDVVLDFLQWSKSHRKFFLEELIRITALLVIKNL